MTLPDPKRRAWLLGHYAVRSKAHESPFKLLPPNPVVLEDCGPCGGSGVLQGSTCEACAGAGTDYRLGVLVDDLELAAAVWPDGHGQVTCPRCNKGVLLSNPAQWRSARHVACGQRLCINA